MGKLIGETHASVEPRKQFSTRHEPEQIEPKRSEQQMGRVREKPHQSRREPNGHGPVNHSVIV